MEEINYDKFYQQTANGLKVVSRKSDMEKNEELKNKIQKGINDFNSNQNFKIVENTINELIKKISKNNRIEEVLIKVTTINSLYSTNVYDIIRLANHILKIPSIDKKLESGDLELIKEISKGHGIKRKNNNGGTELNLYSFASKYCALHNPEKFALFDSFVENEIHTLNCELSFTTKFSKSELRGYDNFYQRIVELQKYCDNEFSIKDLDKFLWISGRSKNNPL